MRMQFVPTPKSTPSRRRPPTGRNRNSSQKVYASENDLPSYKPSDAVSPSTPQKPAPGRTAAPQTQSTNQKQRNKGNKSRSTKNGVTSPGHRLDGESPSLQPLESSAPIFAGSTFHASPAPSALPLPSFLGLSNTDSPAVKAKTPGSAQESYPPETDSDDGSPVDEPVPRNGESPLEFFFRADRAEKARVRRASSANTDAVPTAAFSPLQDSSRKECNTIPRAVAHNSLRRPAFTERNTSPGIPARELDGSSRLHVGPAFSTPYQERIRAARSNPNSAQPTPTVNRNLDPNSSEALKRYLFTGQLGRSVPQEPSPPSSTSQTTHQITRQQHRSSAGQQQGAYPASQRPPFPTPNLSRGVFPASVLTGHAPRVQPASSGHIHAESNPRSDHLRALEGDLRRMLKLDSLG
ncbi:hypothetical protein E0Z10_g1362 [Xylaria hypoxylon]|uniref:Proteophosphoglycan 5 n=1 Tax=Xylaria hypoxylon TaxID=37992 RepID=A0A4Z0YTT6_9PEZI|nr:hypothetical protein E0Z10_g1362 [Xylaria hypoxylon]